jgi:hypothetical protein
MELPVQNLTNIAPALDKSAMDAAKFDSEANFKAISHDTPLSADANKVTLAQSNSANGTELPNSADAGAAPDGETRFAQGYAMPSRTEGSVAGYEQNIYDFNHDQAAGQLRDPDAGRMSNPAEIVNESFQSIGYFIDRDLSTQNRLAKSQGHDVTDMPATNPFIISSNNSFTNVSIPVGSGSHGSREFSAHTSEASGNNNSTPGMVDEKLRGLASYMGDVMLFSYQATLISKVSQSFSSSISTLMRGQ